MRLTSAIVLALALCASMASAQYLGPWTFTWDFDTGLQGWTIGGVGYWVDPNVFPANGPTLPDGQPSGGGTGNLHLPDQSYARLDVSSLNIGSGIVNGQPMNPFVYQVDVYVPNLRPLTGFPNGGPGNHIVRAGLQLLRLGDGRALWFEGNQNYRLAARDMTWDNTERGANWYLMDNSGNPDTQWWDQWVTLQVDYGYTTPGKWAAWAYIPWDNPRGPAGWFLIGNGVWDVHPTGVQWEYLQMGGTASWTQAQFDNARLLVVPIPEPVFFQLGALSGMGMLGLLRLRRRA